MARESPGLCDTVSGGTPIALARVKTWNPGDTLTAADLNAEFNNILNNPISLVSPTTGAINFQTSVAHTNLQVSALTASSGFAGSVLVGSTAATPSPVWSTGAVSGGVFVATTASIPTWLAIGAQSNVLAVTSSGTPTWTGSPAFNSSGLVGTLQTSAGGTGHQSSALTVSNLSLGGGWSTGGTLANFRGFDLAYTVQIVTSGIVAGNPTVTATYGATYATVPVTLFQILSGTSAALPGSNNTITQTSSGMTLTFLAFVPSSSATYNLQVMTLG